MKYAEIDSKQIFVPIEHPKDRCKSGDIVRLAKSIARLGLINPLTVKPLIGGGGYEIVSGNRRFCAAKLAGIKKIPCMVLEKGQQAPLISLTLKRFGSHDPFELADDIKKVLIKNKIPAEKLAELLGMDTSELMELLTPTCMGELEREISRKNLLSADSVRKISTLPTREKRLEALVKSEKKSSVNIKNASNSKLRARRRVSIKDIGFFENTLKRSLEILESAGIRTKKETNERNGEVEYKIKVFGAKRV